MSTHGILDHYLTARSQRLRTMDIPGKVLIDSEVRLVVFSVIVPHSLATHPRSGAASFSQALADSNPVVAAPAAVGVSVATPGEEQDLADTATRRPAMGVQMKGDAKGSGLEEFSMNLTPIFRDQQAFHCLYVKA